MTKLYFLFFFLVLFLQTKSQIPEWKWARAGHSHQLAEGIFVATDKFENAFITGIYYDTLTFNSTALINQAGSPQSIFLAKYDSIGNLKWAKSSIGNTTISSIATDSIGNCYLAGMYQGTVNFGGQVLICSGNSNPFLVKYDSAGNVLWAKGTFSDGAMCYCITTDQFYNIYVTGIFGSPTIAFDTFTLVNQGLHDIFLVKYDSSGNVIWAKSSGGTDDEISANITTDNSGNILMTGGYRSNLFQMGSYTLNHNSLFSNYNFFLGKYDSLGNVQWATSVGDSNFVIGNYLTTDLNNNIYVEGNFNSSYFKECPVHFDNFTLITDSNSNSDAFIIKYDINGNVIWAKGGKIWESYNNIFSSLASNKSGRIYLSGSFGQPTLTFDTVFLINPQTSFSETMFILCIDSSGNSLYGKVLDHGGDDENSLAISPLGAVYVGGDYCNATCSNSNLFVVGNDSLIAYGLEDIFIAKLDYDVTLNVKESNNNSNPIVFPNPFKNNLTISMKEFGNYQLKLFDITSRLLFNRGFEKMLTIDTEEFSKGIYVLQFINGQNQCFNIKLIKN